MFDLGLFQEPKKQVSSPCLSDKVIDSYSFRPCMQSVPHTTGHLNFAVRLFDVPVATCGVTVLLSEGV